MPEEATHWGQNFCFVGELIGDAVWGFGRHTGFRPSCQKHVAAPLDDVCHWYGVMERVDASEDIDAVRSICFLVECLLLVSFNPFKNHECSLISYIENLFLGLGLNILFNKSLTSDESLSCSSGL